jgi:hypothetical protein
MSKEHEFMFVAVMDAEEKTVSHVHGLLRSAGIRFIAEGDGISELCVHPADAERAVLLLQVQRAAGWMVSVSPFAYLKERGRV